MECLSLKVFRVFSFSNFVDSRTRLIAFLLHLLSLPLSCRKMIPWSAQEKQSLVSFNDNPDNNGDTLLTHLIFSDSSSSLFSYFLDNFRLDLLSCLTQFMLWQKECIPYTKVPLHPFLVRRMLHVIQEFLGWMDPVSTTTLTLFNFRDWPEGFSLKKEHDLLSNGTSLSYVKWNWIKWANGAQLEDWISQVTKPFMSLEPRISLWRWQQLR